MEILESISPAILLFEYSISCNDVEGVTGEVGNEDGSCHVHI